MRIQHNIMAMTANRYLGMAYNKQASLSEKLASGYRINRAADNAAGLKISEKMRAQIRGLMQASKNAQDGISFLQTADGALNEVQSILQRIRELTVQSANDTNVSADRTSIQEEVDELIKEVDRIAGQTEFNTRKIFDGSLQGTSGGASTPYQKIDGTEIKIYDLTHEFIARQTANGASAIGSYTALADVLDKEIVPQAVNALLNTYSSAFGYLKDCSTGIGLKFENNKSSSALASVSMGGVNGRYDANGGITYDLKFRLTVNLAYLDMEGQEMTESGRQKLEGTILHEMVHAFMDETLTNGMLNSNSSERYPLWFIEGMAQTAVGGYANFNDWVNGGLGIKPDSQKQDISSVVNNSTNKLTNTSSSHVNYGMGYLACMYLGQLASGKGLSSGSITPQNIRSGLDSILKKLGEGKSLNAVIKEVTEGKYAGITDFQDKFGDTDSVAFICNLTKAVGDGNGSIVGGDFSKVDLLPNAPASTTVFDLNPNAPEVINRYPDDVTVLSGGTATKEGKAPTETYSAGGTGGTTPPQTGGGEINIDTLKTGSGNGYTFDGTTLQITGSGDYTLSGSKNGIHIVIADGAEANIDMKGLTINASGASGITIGDGSKVTLNVSGTNTITSNAAAGIYVKTGGALTITGDGGLTVNAKSGSGAAAIGGENGTGTGTITITGTEGKGLVVDANADIGKSAIGAGKNATGGSVNKINGIIMDGADGSGSVYGKVTISDKLDTKGGKLTVESNATLTVSSGGSIVNRTSDAVIDNKGKILNWGAVGSKVTTTGSGSLKNYISKMTLKQPKDVAVGEKLLSGTNPSAVITYNGKKTTTVNGTWTVKDSSGNQVDALNTLAEEGKKYTYSVTYRLSDEQYASGLSFTKDSSLVNSLIIEGSQAFAAYQQAGASEVTYGSFAMKENQISGDGRSVVITYNMEPSKAPASGGTGGGQGVVDGLMLQVGANEGQGMSITIDKIDSKALSIDGLSVMSHKEADESIGKCDDAINKVSSVRSRIGAYQNRLEYAVANLDNTAENLQAAESRIRDLDIASAMVEYAKNAIIIQAAQAMLAQANQNQSGILKLLQ